MKIRIVLPELVLGFLAASQLCVAAVAESAAARPNILVFFSDDLGQDGLGSFGSFRYGAVELPEGEDAAAWRDPWGRPARPSQTPAIDKLAAEGLRFTRCYATGICSPSRAQFATGQYPFRNGVLDIDGIDDIRNPNRPSLTKLMDDAGYLTGKTGKCDLDITDPQEEFQLGQYWVKEKVGHSRPRAIGPTKVAVDAFDYAPDGRLAFTIDFLERNAPSPANGNRPFYFIHGFSIPHSPVHPTPDSLEFHGGAPAGETAKERTERHGDDMIRYMDKIVATVTAKLEELGQLDNTFILFVGDNGSAGHIVNQLWDPESGDFRTIEGTKADRRHNREGTALVPMIVHWPDGLPPARRGTVIDDSVDFCDYLPTFGALAGVRPPENWVLDGHNILPLIEGAPHESRAWTFHQIQNNWCVRGVDYRLDRDGAFFDMRDAPFQSAPIQNPTPEQAVIRDQLQAVLDEFDPANGPTYEAHQDHLWGGRKRAKDNPGIAAIWGWKKKHFFSPGLDVTRVSGDASDPDEDGVSNALERVFGWDPKNGSDQLPQPVPAAGELSVTLPAIENVHTRAIVEESAGNGAWRELAPQKRAAGYVFTSTASSPDKIRIRAERTAQWPEP